MNANHDLERRIADFYLTEAPQRAPDWVLREALSSIDTTPQRRVLIRMPLRFPRANAYASMAVAAAIVIAVGTIGLAAFLRGTDQTGGPQVTPSPSPSASPSPSPTVPPALTETFTSSMHGISVGHPAGWLTQRATETWTSGVPQQDTEFGDLICSFGGQPIPAEADCWASPVNIFVSLASQPLGGMSGGDWIADFLTVDAKCGTITEPVTIDGTPGVIARDCIDAQAALIAVDDRGYLIWLYATADDDPALAEPYDRAWFDQLLATVELHPEDAVDEAPSASP